MAASATRTSLPVTVDIPPARVLTPATEATPAAPPGDVVLDVRNLRTYFFTYDGVVKALDGVDLTIHRGETLGLVGETGCGKSVTAFSVTKLVADPPGRIMAGSIRFKGANLLWGLDREATFRPVKNTNRVKVKRRYRRVKAGQSRMSAIRGAGISMIFQEPTSAMNPIFSISNQVSEAILLHRGPEIIDRVLGAHPLDPQVDAAIENMAKVARQNDSEALQAAAEELAVASGLPTFGTQAYYLFRGAWLDPESKIPDVKEAQRRLRLSSVQRAYLKHRRRLHEIDGKLHAVYLAEMRNEEADSGAERSLRARRRGEKLSHFFYGLWGLRGHVQRPLKDETFWETVRLLESVTIANPVQVARGYPHELSGGMLQRVMIAMALSSEPSLLIADEPTTALDVTIQAQILELMRQLKKRIGTAILLITHDLGVIAEVSDRVCVMYAGVVVETAPVRELYLRPLHPYTQGLLASIPRMDRPDKRLDSIPGSVPNLIDPPSGCRFHPRCPHAMPICKEVRPPTTVEGPSHTVACYLYNGPKAAG